MNLSSVASQFVLVSFRKTESPGCAGESKRAYAVSFERSEMVFNTKKMRHAMGRTPFTRGMASDAGDRAFSAS